MSIMINNEVHCEIISEILRELERASKLHPNYTSDVVRQTAVVVEEGLEAMTVLSTRMERLVKAALGATRDSAGDTNKEASMADLEMELIQTAAMCIRMLEAMHAARLAQQQGDGYR